MKHKEHRLGVSEVNLVTRHLGLKRPINTEKLTEAIAEIDQLYGLDDIAFVETSDRLDFSYDASRLCLQCVEDILIKSAFQSSRIGGRASKRSTTCSSTKTLKTTPNMNPGVATEYLRTIENRDAIKRALDDRRALPTEAAPTGYR